MNTNGSSPRGPLSRSARWSDVTLPRAHVEWGGLSDPGQGRTRNEDSFFVGRFDRTLEPVLTNLQWASGAGWHYEAGYVAMVADGMGGEAAGEVASQTAVLTLLELATDTPDWVMRYDEDSLVAEVSRRIEERVRRVDELLASMGRLQPRLSGLGTTLTILALLPPDALIAHVGDSRAYLLRDDRLTRLTRDHTKAQELADAGIIEPRQVASHPKHLVLTRAAGHGQGHLEVDVQRLRVQGGDHLLLCTDGLTEMLPDDEIRHVLASAGSSAMACQNLVALALERGGTDNITAVVGRV